MNGETDVFVTAAMGIALAWACVAVVIVCYYVWKKVRDGRSD